ncbi:MAG: hypothetical protein M1816_000080 [Peltula sp. TS41687]|nr:MAG: hypothetical protein M1816_000080 [Peltula sp. TS41687]
MAFELKSILGLAVVLSYHLISAQAGLVRREAESNRTLCVWEQPRGEHRRRAGDVARKLMEHFEAAVLRDAFYIDGGLLTYIANGSVRNRFTPEDSEAMYAINFTQAFNTSQNASQVLRRVEKTAGAAINLAPNSVDGTIFSNDNELLFYGGLLRDTQAYEIPPSNNVLSYERFQYGPNREAWKEGLIQSTLPDGMSRYITAGAAVNVPSENLGFYFSGLRRPDWGDIRRGGDAMYNATVPANTLISVDMSTMRKEKWENVTLPSSIPGRANAELVWIPTAERGLLIAIGGVIYPEWAFKDPSGGLQSQSRDASPGFMSTVSVYDIKNQKWYTQATTGSTPPQLTRFCSVVTAAKDGSSSNIYIYGGYDGLEDTSAPIDDVYILSVPSFTWFKAYTGNKRHGRRSHKCARIYPDQMLVVGGQTDQADEYTCLEGGMLQIFNLNTLAWQDRYDPTVWSEYKVPRLVTDKIGGNADGGATLVAPSTWGDNALRALFATKYTKTVTNYYPYASVTSSNTPPGVSTVRPNPPSQSSGTPSWLAPVLGVVLGLIGVCAILGGVFLWYTRKRRRSGASHVSNSGFRSRIESWMQGTQPPKAPTVTSMEGTHSLSTGTTALGSTGDLVPKEVNTGPQETAGSPVYELPATSRVTELPTMGQLGFTPSSTMQPGSRPRPQTHVSQPSFSSSLSGGTPRPESPTAENTPGHRRQVSSLTSADFPSPTSTVGGFTGVERENPLENTDVVSPVTPPERIDRDGYLNTSRLGQLDFSRSNNTSPTSSFSSLTSSITNGLRGIGNGIVDNLTDIIGIRDFYSAHLLNYCKGSYRPNDTAPNASKDVTHCSRPMVLFAFDPTKIFNSDLKGGISLTDLRWPQAVDHGVRVLKAAFIAIFVVYVVGIVLTAMALVQSFFRIFDDRRFVLAISMVTSLSSFLALGIASGIETAVSVKAVELVNRHDNGIGISASQCIKFLYMTWFATVLMLLATMAWACEWMSSRRQGPQSIDG